MGKNYNLYVRVPPELIEAVKRLAVKQDRSLNGMVVHIFKKYVAVNEPNKDK